MMYQFKISTIVLLILLFTVFVSCKNKARTYPEMEEFYVESCNLTNAKEDSVERFNQKFIKFTNKNYGAIDDARYPHILENTFLVTKKYQDERKELMKYLYWKSIIFNSKYKDLPQYILNKQVTN